MIYLTITTSKVRQHYSYKTFNSNEAFLRFHHIIILSKKDIQGVPIGIMIYLVIFIDRYSIIFIAITS